MKKISIVLFSLALILFNSCKKLPEGYLSNIIRYEKTPIILKQGRTEISDPIVVYGSSRPLHITLAKVYNRETGEDMTNVFLKKYPLKIWKSYYDIVLDKTIELVDKRRIDSLVYPISINPLSGQLESNYNTKFLPLGHYGFDLEIENVVGKIYYASIGEFDLIGAPNYELPSPLFASIAQVSDENVQIPIYSGFEAINVEYVDNQENKIILRFLDQNGLVFNPKSEIQRKPNIGTVGSFIQTLEDYSFTATPFDDRIEYTYGVIPFPFYPLGFGFVYGYRIPAASVAYSADFGLPYNAFSCDIQFSFQAFDYGTYFIDIHMPYISRVP